MGDHANFPSITPVFKKPLALFSQKPMTGFYRDGYCRVGPEDGGNHAVAGMHPRSLPPYTYIRSSFMKVSVQVADAPSQAS